MKYFIILVILAFGVYQWSAFTVATETSAEVQKALDDYQTDYDYGNCNNMLAIESKSQRYVCTQTAELIEYYKLRLLQLKALGR